MGTGIGEGKDKQIVKGDNFDYHDLGRRKAKLEEKIYLRVYMLISIMIFVLY